LGCDIVEKYRFRKACCCPSE